jgi:hypothetical protein
VSTFNKQLANKFYFYSLGLYGSIISVFGFLYVFKTGFNLTPIIAIFLAYFITVFWRSLYDQIVIHELYLRQINYKNNSILSLISATLFALLYYFIREPLGDWAIPITIIISMKIIGEIQKSYGPHP